MPSKILFFIFTKILTCNSSYGLMYVVCWFTFAKLATLTEGLAKLNPFDPDLTKGETFMDIGEKLRQLRLQRGLTQEELADRCELSKGFISQVERNLASPSIATLMDMLECLGSSLQAFFSEKATEKTVFAPQDMFVKEDEETLMGSITWLIPDAQKNEMEPILVEIGPGGQTSPMPPSEGEEFGYVLSGSILLCVGEKKTRVKTGSSFCLHPRESHYLSNPGKTRAKVLWVSTPPSF